MFLPLLISVAGLVIIRKCYKLNNLKHDRWIFNNTVLKLQVTIITTTITAAALQDRNSGYIDFTRYNSKQTMIGSGTQPLGFALRKILLKIDFSTKLQ